MMPSRVRCLASLLVFGALVYPSTAAGKQGAILDPQLLALPLGQTARVQLLVLPMYRGGPLGPREVTPAPAAGSVPVVTLRQLGGGRVLRFTGTPLDRRGESVVWVRLPASSAPQRWEVWVGAGGHLYPDLVDSSVIDRSATPAATPNQAAPLGATSAARGHSGSSPAWPFVLGGLALAAVACGFALDRAGRVGRMLPRGVRR